MLVLVFISADYTLEEKRTESSLLEELERGLAEPLVFVLNANLLAVVKIVSCMLLMSHSTAFLVLRDLICGTCVNRYGILYCD